jgi:hypothetical protein
MQDQATTLGKAVSAFKVETSSVTFAAPVHVITHAEPGRDAKPVKHLTAVLRTRTQALGASSGEG